MSETPSPVGPSAFQGELDKLRAAVGFEFVVCVGITSEFLQGLATSAIPACGSMRESVVKARFLLRDALQKLEMEFDDNGDSRESSGDAHENRA